MFKYACRDLGVDCDYVVSAASAEEVKEKVLAHAGTVHEEMLKAMGEAELAQLSKAVDGAIKPV